MSLACPHCGIFKMAPLVSEKHLRDHLFYVHHEGWPEPVTLDEALGRVEEIREHILGVDDSELGDPAGAGRCDECGNTRRRRRHLGRYLLCVDCALRRVNAGARAA